MDLTSFGVKNQVEKNQDSNLEIDFVELQEDLIKNAKEQPVQIPQFFKNIAFELKLRWIKKV